MDNPIALMVSNFNRTRKWKQFLQICNFDENTTVLDAGFSDFEYNDSTNYLERNYPYLHNVTALGLDQNADKAGWVAKESSDFCRNYPQVRVVRYGGKEFPFLEEKYDICWSNAVIEHVGDRKAQVLFLSEIARVSRIAFVTTPCKYFPVEVHTGVLFLHFLLPKPLLDQFLRWIGKDWATGDFMNLLSSRDLEGLLATAGIKRYRIIKNRFFGLVLDFVVVFGDNVL